MDENHSDDQEILRKRILDEKQDLIQSDDTNLSGAESGSVFNSYSRNTLNDGPSLFHSGEDSNPSFESSEPTTNSLFSSRGNPAEAETLFSYNHDVQEGSISASEYAIDSLNASIDEDHILDNQDIPTGQTELSDVTDEANPEEPFAEEPAVTNNTADADVPFEMEPTEPKDSSDIETPFAEEPAEPNDTVDADVPLEAEPAEPNNSSEFEVPYEADTAEPEAAYSTDSNYSTEVPYAPKTAEPQKSSIPHDDSPDSAIPQFISYKASNSSIRSSDSAHQKYSTQDNGVSDDSSDAAFPLFLSFKANDSMQTVSEGVHEKYASQPGVQSGNYENSGNSTLDSESDIHSSAAFSYPESSEIEYTDTGKPVFKPYRMTNEEYKETSKNTPDEFVSSDDGHAGLTSKPVVEQPSGSPTVRPGARYTAAQQMGNITPLPERTLKPQKSRSHLAVIILLLCVVAIVAVIALWKPISAGFVSSKNNSVSTTGTISPPTIEATAAATASAETTAVETAAETTAAETTTETTSAETTAAETTAQSTASPTPAMIPSGFSTSIINGKSTDDAASFDILFKNSGASDVSLFDGVEFITVAYTTSNVKITEVTSPDFTFTADPNKYNFFIGTPTSKDVIAKKDTKTVTVTAKSDGKTIGKFTIKYFVKCYS